MAFAFAKFSSILVTVSLFLICTLVDLTECLGVDDESASNLQTTSKNCSKPKPVVEGAMLKWQDDHPDGVFKPGEKAEFVCKKGYRQIGWLKSLTCQTNGSWSSRSSPEDKSSRDAEGYCVTNHCNHTGIFNCTAGGMSVDICKRCNCITDCRDGSDEEDCGPVLINVTEMATGDLRYPVHKSRSPRNCSWTLWTDEPGFYIKLLFTKFAFPEGCDKNFLFFENTTFDTTPVCCKKNEGISCGFGAKSGLPSLSHTAKNFMVIFLSTQRTNATEFRAKWYNVNGLFPSGVLPKGDDPYPFSFKIPRKKAKKVEEEKDTAHVAAVVIFCVFGFVVLVILACKVGRRFIGPRCSLGYCCAWVKTRRNRRSSRVSSPEQLPIRSEINDDPTQPRIRRTDQANDDPTTFRTRYGSAENVA